MQIVPRMRGRLCMHVHSMRRTPCPPKHSATTFLCRPAAYIAEARQLPQFRLWKIGKPASELPAAMSTNFVCVRHRLAAWGGGIRTSASRNQICCFKVRRVRCLRSRPKTMTTATFKRLHGWLGRGMPSAITRGGRGLRGGLPRARLPTTLIIAIAPGNTRFTVEGLRVISREAFTKRESRRRP